MRAATMSLRPGAVKLRKSLSSQACRATSNIISVILSAAQRSRRTCSALRSHLLSEAKPCCSAKKGVIPSHCHPQDLPAAGPRDPFSLPFFASSGVKLLSA
jgi:hypothetical protein